MTAKNRKNNSSEKNASSSPDDVAKKSMKSNGVNVTVPQGSGSGSWVTFVAALCYIVLVAAAGFAAFYLQQVLEEVNQINKNNEESVKKNAELTRKMENVVQQVDSLRSAIDGVESALTTTRVELEGVNRAVRKGDSETRRVEEALLKLQNDLLRDLSDGIGEVKQAREQDFSSLEKTVGQRLAEVSDSIAASVEEFAEAQRETQGQLAGLKARLGDIEEPALIKQELSAIAEVVAELSTSKQATEASADSLREQISSVGAELQTRNQEVASLSKEVETVRLLVQETTGSLRQSISTAEDDVKALTDKTETLEGGLGMVTETLLSLEKELQAKASQTETLEGRVTTADEKVESLLTKCNTHESALATQGQAIDTAKASLQGEVGALKGHFEELHANFAALTGTLGSKSSSIFKQIEEYGKKLDSLEQSTKSGSPTATAKKLETLSSAVHGLEGKAAKLESHEKAISALQDSLKKTMTSLEILSKTPNKNKKV